MNTYIFKPLAILCSIMLFVSCATPSTIPPTSLPVAIATETPPLPSATVTLPSPTPISNILPLESNLHQAACQDIANIGHNPSTLQKVYNNYGESVYWTLSVNFQAVEPTDPNSPLACLRIYGRSDSSKTYTNLLDVNKFPQFSSGDLRRGIAVRGCKNFGNVKIEEKQAIFNGNGYFRCNINIRKLVNEAGDLGYTLPFSVWIDTSTLPLEITRTAQISAFQTSGQLGIGVAGEFGRLITSTLDLAKIEKTFGNRANLVTKALTSTITFIYYEPLKECETKRLEGYVFEGSCAPFANGLVQNPNGQSATVSPFLFHHANRYDVTPSVLWGVKPTQKAILWTEVGSGRGKHTSEGLIRICCGIYQTIYNYDGNPNNDHPVFTFTTSITNNLNSAPFWIGNANLYIGGNPLYTNFYWSGKLHEIIFDPESDSSGADRG